MGYFAPTDVQEALELLSANDLSVVAGGTDYYPMLGDRPVEKGILDITRIAGLRGIAREGGRMRFGAATRWSDIVRADLPPAFAGLQAAAREVGSVQIQNAGTLAGNICNASPAADGVPPLLTLGAEVEIAGTAGVRQEPLAAFITGVRRTRLAPGELVTAVTTDVPPDGSRGAFEKLGSRAYLVISITMVAVVVGCDAVGRISLARVAVGACSPVAMRLSALERALVGQRPAEVRVSDSDLAGLAPITDVRGEADYRREAVAVQIARAVQAAGGAVG